MRSWNKDLKCRANWIQGIEQTIDFDFNFNKALPAYRVV